MRLDMGVILNGLTNIAALLSVGTFIGGVYALMVKDVGLIDSMRYGLLFFVMGMILGKLSHAYIIGE